MRYSASLMTLYITFCAVGVSDLDYRGSRGKLQVTAQRMSPAFAALEDTHAIPSLNFDTSSSSQEIKFEKLYAGQPETTRINLPKLVIAHESSTPLNDVLQKAHATLIKNAPIVVGQNTKAQWSGIVDSTAQIKNRLGFRPKMLSSSYGSKNVVSTSDVRSSNTRSIEVDGTEILIGGPMLGSDAAPTTGIDSRNHQLGILSSSRLATAGKSVSTNNSNAQRTKLKGQIVLSEGAVYPGESFNFYIQRTFDGMTQERGSVDPYTGEFEIDVLSMRGKVSVELRHETGAAIAYGDLQLSKLDKSLNELQLRLYPTDQISVIGQVLSYETFDDIEVAVAENPIHIHLDGDNHSFTSNTQGKFQESHVAAGSQVLMSASHQGFWRTIELAETGKPIYPIMHSDKRMQMMLSLLESYLPKSKIHSVIWGRISHEGTPLKGAHVTLQGFEDIQPLYFNLRIPNPGLNKTSEDGYFAFINPPEGLHLIRAQHSKIKIPYESTVVKANHTSIARMETAPLKPVTMRVYDAFASSQALSARISIPGNESSWWLSQQRENVVQFYDRSTPMPMDIDVQPEFVNLRTFVNRRRTQLDVPVIKKIWLNQILARHKVNLAPRTGMLIGFVNNGDHNLDLSLKTAETTIIYFDKNGMPTPKLSDGGGFLAVNVPQGLVTASVKVNNDKTYKTLSLVEGHRLSLISLPAQISP